MKLDIAELRRLAEAATPSPWTVRETVINGTGYGGHWVEPGCVGGIQITGSGGAVSFTDRVFDRQPHDDNEANARFVAAWRNAALDLLDRLASAEAALWVFAEAADEASMEKRKDIPFPFVVSVICEGLCAAIEHFAAQV